MAKPSTSRRQPAARTGPKYDSVVRLIRKRTRSPQFRKHLANLLIELCRVDTTPSPEVNRMRLAEEACFRIIERELSELPLPGARLQRRPINPAIRTHPNYSLLHFTKTAKRPAGLTPERTYAGRSNLVLVVPGAEVRPGLSLALNAHVDTVAPYFPPRVKGGVVFGRGACDDKGPVVAIVAALRLVADLVKDAGLKWNRSLAAMFVVEEETGGNGSLSMAMDRGLKALYDSILVCECTGLKVHPANRGAVWYRAAFKPMEGVPLLELFAFVNEEMEKEGAALRAESRHALFPQRPVQTCHGILGPFGEHPSRICGEVSFLIDLGRKPDARAELLVRDCLEAGLAGYVGLYGDKTQVKDPATGKAMVSRHYDLRRAANGFRVDVHGATGHMGAIRERDGAITKMAHLVRSLVFSKAKLVSIAGRTEKLLLAESAPSIAGLVAEGGQGFVPTHSIDEVMDRLRRAARRGAERYLRRIERNESADQIVTVTYEKLHNTAFDGNPDSLSMRNALAAARACGLWKNEPVLGWTVSCDARLFASEYPGMDVLTFGPGQLSFAHSDQEQIAIEDIRRAVEFLSLFLLRQTGTVAA